MQMNSAELFFQFTLSQSPFTGQTYVFIQGYPEALSFLFSRWKESVLQLLPFPQSFGSLQPVVTMVTYLFRMESRNNVKQRQIHIRLD